MVVEDDEMQREVASVVLEECDMDVIPCETAEDATAILESLSRKPAMVFTDVRLPGALTGADLAYLVRAKFPEARLLVTSGDEIPPVLPDGARFIPKPWTTQELMKEASALA
jgi:CheY-like chemotaxis protein